VDLRTHRAGGIDSFFHYRAAAADWVSRQSSATPIYNKTKIFLPPRFGPKAPSVGFLQREPKVPQFATMAKHFSHHSPLEHFFSKENP